MKLKANSIRHYAAMGILATIFAAPAASGHELFRPYIGAGFQVLKLDLDKAYGQPLFKQAVPGSAAFLGIRIGNYVGVELGYNYFSQKQNKKLNSQDIFPGSGETVFTRYTVYDWIEYKTQVLIREVNLGLTGYLPLERVAKVLDKTELFATLGASRTSVLLTMKSVGDSFDGPAINSATHTFKQLRTIPFAKLGLQQNITENINLSLFSEWKRLTAFKMKAPTNSVLELHLKNSVSYGLRVGYMF